MSDDENEPDDRIKKIMEDEKRRPSEFGDLLIQCSQGQATQEIKNALVYFMGVSLKLRDTELKLHLAELKVGVTESNLETARTVIQMLYEIATEAPQSQLRDDVTSFIDGAKQRATAQGVQL